MLTQWFRHFDRFVADEAGNAVTEYAVMLSLIVILAIGAITMLGSKMDSLFRFEHDQLSAISQ